MAGVKPAATKANDGKKIDEGSVGRLGWESGWVFQWLNLLPIGNGEHTDASVCATRLCHGGGKGCPNLRDGSAATEAKSKATATAGGREAQRYKVERWQKS